MAFYYKMVASRFYGHNKISINILDHENTCGK